MNVTAVIFDMGGVLVNLGPMTEILGPDPTLSPDEFWRMWLASPTMRDFERGRCTPAEFGERFVNELRLDMKPADLVARFAAWPKGLFDGAAELVADTNAVADTAVLSNTNALHWDTQTDGETMRSLFSRHYLSFELGLVKPDADIFEHIVADLDRPGTEILFLDDNQINVDAARAAGILSERAVGVAEARAAIESHGLTLGR